MDSAPGKDTPSQMQRREQNVRFKQTIAEPGRKNMKASLLAFPITQVMQESADIIQVEVHVSLGFGF